MNAKPRNLSECFTERMLAMPEPLIRDCITSARSRSRKSANPVPVMSNRDHIRDALLVENVQQVLSYCGVQKVGRVSGLWFRSTKSEKVGNDQSVSPGLKIVDLVVPVIRRRRESVDKQESWPSGEWLGEEIVIYKISVGFLEFREYLVHGDGWCRAGCHCDSLLYLYHACPIGCQFDYSSIPVASNHQTCLDSHPTCTAISSALLVCSSHFLHLGKSQEPVRPYIQGFRSKFPSPKTIRRQTPSQQCD